MKKTGRDNDPGMNELMAEVLIISLVVVLGGIVGSVMLGYISLPQKSNLSPFAVNPVQNKTTGNTSLELHLVTGDNLHASNAGSAGSYAIRNMTFNIIDPNGTRYQVVMCRSMPTDTVVKPGTQLFIFQRQKGVFFLANSPDMPSCGGGGGGGGGTGGQTNLAYLPHGAWRLTIADTGNANMVVFDGKINL